MADFPEPVASPVVVETPPGKKPFWWPGPVVVLLFALVVFFGVKTGYFSGSIGTSLDQPLTTQFSEVAGSNLSITCPPGAKFFAGATIICDVTGVDAASLMPHLMSINVEVSTHDQYHALPVNGY